MRIKFLSAIISFIIVSVSFSACLDGDDNYAYSSDPTIHAFGIDTIHGQYYKFTIDQLNRLIYNKDSMPMGADTILDRILIDTLTVTGWVTSGTPTDTLLNTADSLDLTPAINADGEQGIKLHSHAADGTERIYTLQIRVHRQDPDSLTWQKLSDSDPLPASPWTTASRSVILKEELLLYTSPTTLYKHPTDPLKTGWTEHRITGLSATAEIQSAIVFCQRVYMRDAEGDLYISDDGIQWHRAESLSGGVEALVAVFPANEVTRTGETLTAIRRTADGIMYHVRTTATEEDAVWEEGEPVEEGFPTREIRYTALTTANGVNKVVLVGLPHTDDRATTPWFSMDGREWADLSTTSAAFCPQMDHPFIAYYGGKYYCMGGEMETIYASDSGIAWYATERKVLLPEEMKGLQAPTIIVDPSPKEAAHAEERRDFIWVIGGGNGTPFEVWRGRLNRLGFEQTGL